MSAGETRSARIEALIAAAGGITSDYERGLDRLSIGFGIVERAVDAAGRNEISLAQLAASLAVGKRHLAAASTLLVFELDEQGLKDHLESEQWLVNQVEQELLGRGTDAGAIRRLHEGFVDRQPQNWIAVASGIGGASTVRQAVDRFRQGATADDSLRAQIEEANQSLQIARIHLNSSGEPLGARFAAYIDTHLQLSMALLSALSLQ
jgi:hypothetical protein